MKVMHPILAVSIATASLGLITAGVVVHGQHATTTKPTTTAAPATAAAPQAVEQQRDAIWNSPEMLRARAWVTDYCTNSKKMSPAEAKEYMTELENLSPKQMKLWLLQYEHQQELYVQKESAQQVAHRAAMAHASAAHSSVTAPDPEAMRMWQMQHQASLNQAMAADRATQQSYNAIEKEETQAANEEQGQLNAEQQFSRQMQEDKQADLNNPYPIYGGWGYGGYGGYGGGVHFHFH
jgi:hypothetical protein